jgi:hypothetical protein
MSWTTHMVAVAALASACTIGCKEDGRNAEPASSAASSVDPPPRQGLSSAAGTSRKRIGDPCANGDGWQEPEYGSLVPAGGPPVVTSMHGMSVTRRDQLPPGTGFCLSGGEVYPNGYFTMNCQRDADCPGGAQCDGVNLCRKPCTSDAECQSPSACKSAPDQSVRYCWLARGRR